MYIHHIYFATKHNFADRQTICYDECQQLQNKFNISLSEESRLISISRVVVGQFQLIRNMIFIFTLVSRLLVLIGQEELNSHWPGDSWFPCLGRLVVSIDNTILSCSHWSRHSCLIGRYYIYP